MVALLLDGSVFTAAQAKSNGITAWCLAEMVRRGRVRRLLHDAYVDAQVPDTVELRARALCLVMPACAVICRRTAAWLYGVDAYAPNERDQALTVECVVPARLARVRRDGVRGWEETLDPEDLSTVHGVRVTTPTRTALDLARYAPRFMGLSAVDAFCHRALTTPSELMACAQRFCGGRNIAIARQLIGWAEPLAESPGESWLRLRILDAGFPRPQAQIKVYDTGGRMVYRLDLGYPALKIGLEYDGLEFHDSPEHRKHDVHRRRELDRIYGWDAYGFDRGDVLGMRPTVELVVGGLLGIEPLLPRRW
jgi:AbiEi antitoxin C-terminal domain